METVQVKKSIKRKWPTIHTWNIAKDIGILVAKSSLQGAAGAVGATVVYTAIRLGTRSTTAPVIALQKNRVS